jgi:hypothetical protein
MVSYSELTVSNSNIAGIEFVNCRYLEREIISKPQRNDRIIPEVKERMIDWMIYAKLQEYKRKGFNKSQIARKPCKDYKTILKYWNMCFW